MQFWIIKRRDKVFVLNRYFLLRIDVIYFLCLWSNYWMQGNLKNVSTTMNHEDSLRGENN